MISLETESICKIGFKFKTNIRISLDIILIFHMIGEAKKSSWVIVSNNSPKSLNFALIIPMTIDAPNEEINKQTIKKNPSNIEKE